MAQFVRVRQAGERVGERRRAQPARVPVRRARTRAVRDLPWLRHRAAPGQGGRADDAAPRDSTLAGGSERSSAARSAASSAVNCVGSSAGPRQAASAAASFVARWEGRLAMSATLRRSQRRARIGGRRRPARALQGLGKLLSVLDAQRRRLRFGQRGVLGAAGRVEAGGFMVSGLGLLQCLLKLLLGSVRGCDGGLQRGRVRKASGTPARRSSANLVLCGRRWRLRQTADGRARRWSLRWQVRSRRLQLRAQRRELGCGGACGFQLTAQDCG